jgi:3-oxoacyl-(acyl-carrier-protein) synthase
MVANSQHSSCPENAVHRGQHAPHMDVQDVCSPLFPACLAALQVTAGLSNSFGFGGHNSAVVFAPFEA